MAGPEPEPMDKRPGREKRKSLVPEMIDLKNPALARHFDHISEEGLAGLTKALGADHPIVKSYQGIWEIQSAIKKDHDYIRTLDKKFLEDQSANPLIQLIGPEARDIVNRAIKHKEKEEYLVKTVTVLRKNRPMGMSRENWDKQVAAIEKDLQAHVNKE